jgi:hypothetical protein
MGIDLLYRREVRESISSELPLVKKLFSFFGTSNYPPANIANAYISLYSRELSSYNVIILKNGYS